MYIHAAKLTAEVPECCMSTLEDAGWLKLDLKFVATGCEESIAVRVLAPGDTSRPPEKNCLWGKG